jgi:hypothetical protein
MRIQRDSGNTSTTLIQTLQNYETVNTIPLAGQTVTLSWYAKAGANFSATSSQMFAQVYTGTGTDQNVLSGYTGSVGLLSAAVTITTSYVKYSQTFTIGSTATEMAIVFGFNPTGTASTNDWVEITGVQLEVGSAATAFSRTGGTYQGELAACQRYYWRNTTAQGFGGLGGTGFTTSTIAGSVQIVNPVPMRTYPSSVDIGTLRYVDSANSAANITSASLISLSTNATNISITDINIAFTGGTANRSLFLGAQGSGGYIGFSAEL